MADGNNVLAEASQQEHQGRRRHRSPAYPAIGLRNAVGRIQAIYGADRTAGSPRDAALQHMGFNRAHGQALAVLSALKKYGLVEEQNRRVTLTRRALEILVRPENDQRRTEAVRAAARAPDIYRELLEQFDEGLPSDESLYAELITDKGFNPNAVNGFIRDFRDTLDFAGLSPQDVLESDPGGSDMSPDRAQEAPANRPDHPNLPPETGRPDMFGSFFGANDDPSKMYSWPLGKGVKAILEFKGQTVTRDHLTRLQKYLDLFKEAIEDSNIPKAE